MSEVNTLIIKYELIESIVEVILTHEVVLVVVFWSLHLNGSVEKVVLSSQKISYNVKSLEWGL